MIPGYRILRPVGNGAAARIFLAEAPCGQRVALKFVDGTRPSGSAGMKDLKREYKTLSMLQHPSIPRVLDLRTVDGGACLVREYCNGDSLRRLMRESLPRVKGTLSRVLEISGDALQHMHDRGFIHRDFKPENVVVGDDGEVFLVDMALAWRRRFLASLPPLAGTPAYMAPELFRGRRPSPASDAYSFAATAYEMLAGRVPYEGNSREEVLKSIATGGAPPPSRRNRTVTADLDRLVMSGLAPDPRARPADLTAYGHRIAESLRTTSLGHHTRD